MGNEIIEKIVLPVRSKLIDEAGTPVGTAANPIYTNAGTSIAPIIAPIVIAVAGLSLEATQILCKNLLASINSKITACNTGAIAGAVTANAGTNLNTSELALETGGNLAGINAKLVSGTDIGDVTINNAGAGSAVNIQDGGNVITVDGFPAEYPLPTAQVVTLTPPAAITGFATSAKQLADGHNVAVLNMIPAVETGLATSANQNIPATTEAEYNITCTNVNTEYSQALPANTRSFEFQNRSGNALRWSFTTGKVATPTAPYNTLKAGGVEFKEGVNLTSKTLYFASATAGDIVELVVYT